MVRAGARQNFDGDTAASYDAVASYDDATASSRISTTQWCETDSDSTGKRRQAAPEDAGRRLAEAFIQAARVDGVAPREKGQTWS